MNQPAKTPPGSGRPRRGEATVMAALFLLLCGYYFWAIMPERGLFSERGNPREYYNLLVDGFRSGHTYLAAQPDPRLVALANPYDPIQALPYMMHDAAYFRGHFYLYFGVTPAVTLFWPCVALTGRYLSDSQVIWIDVCLGLGFALALIARIRWRFFPQAATWHLVSAGLAVGLCSMVPALLARPSVWETPISSAYAFSSAALFFLFGAAYGRRPLLSLCLASLCWGLAVGGRPTYAFGAVILLVPAWIAWASGSPQRNREVIGRLLAAILPISLVVAGLLAYNQARFANPLDFGFKYQMNGSDVRSIPAFSVGAFDYNSWLYLFSRAHWTPYFPFVRIIAAPPPPAAYYGIEDPYGILPNLPITLFALLLVIRLKALREARPFATGVGAATVIVTATVSCFGGACNRYMVDFVPLWILAAAIVLFALVEGAGAFRWLVSLLWALALAVSLTFGIFSGLGHNELLRVAYPRTYASLAHALDWPSRVAALATGKHYRPLSLTVKLPKGRDGKLEPLVVSGVGFLSDYVYLLYSGKDSLIIGYEHTGNGGPTTQLIPVDYDRPHVITIEGGFLLPPLESPYFDRIGTQQAQRRRSQYRVSVDGVTYLETSAPAYDPTSFSPLIGRSSPDRGAFGPAFTGEILSVSDAPSSPSVVPPLSGTPLRLGVRLPPFTGVRAEPLITTGITGAGDSLYLRYLDAVHVVLGFDHWGVGGPESAPIAINPAYVMKFTISLGSFYSGSPPAGANPAEWEALRHRLFVSLNDKTVFDARADFYPSQPPQNTVGSNTIGTSSSTPQFSGTILGRGPAPLSDIEVRPPSP